MQVKSVKYGIDNIKSIHKLLANKKLGLIINHTSVNSQIKFTADLLKEKYNVVALFAPEHGVRGEKQAGVKFETYFDESTSLPVYSLYNKDKTITSDMIQLIDVLIYDIQDIGSRYYTYQYTLTNALYMCKKHNKKIIILDRVNILGLDNLQGNILDINFSSFVGKYETPIKNGLTIGEFALYINKTYNINANLTVCKCIDYSRDTQFENTNITFIPPSPNITSIDCANIYVGTCLFEGTNLSEGRGTTKPFEQFGAPFLNNKLIIEKINRLNLKGFILRETYFTPTFSKFEGQLCNGIFIHITDKKVFNAFQLVLYILEYIKNSHSQFYFLPSPKPEQKPFIDLLFGSDKLRKGEINIEEYLVEQEEKLNLFYKSSKKFHLY